MSKYLISFGVACLMALMASVLVPNAPLAAEDTKAPDEVVIKSSLWKNLKYQPVKFNHKKHAQDYKTPCTECHHIYRDGKNIWKQGEPVRKCDACHTCAKTGRALKSATPEEKKLSLYDAYHGRKGNCHSCHQKYNREKASKAAPTKCTACHAALAK